MNSLAVIAQRAYARASARRSDPVATALGWLWALGAGATVILLIQITQNELGHHAVEAPRAPYAAPDQIAVRT
ncbi:hypothetical protein ACIBK8_21470 [Streptomyces sp. NPDC050161]|uniref:hypothetical protein n=1 Tax=Streptomyces sp. NPDC050161 TaxID=3365604 RepID=UPI0037B418D8